MPQYIRDPEGGMHEFDDNASDDEIRKQMLGYIQRRAIPAGPPTTPPPGTVPGGFTPNPSAPEVSFPPLSGNAEKGRRVMLLGGLSDSRAMEAAGHQMMTTDPSYLYQTETTKKVADQNAQRTSLQEAGTQILPGVKKLRGIIDAVPESVFADASGPYNAQKQPASTEKPFSYGAWKAPDMTPTQARASYGLYQTEPENQAWTFQNALNHQIGVMTEQMIASAPKGTGAGGSDKRTELFHDLMDKLKFAPNKAEAQKIVDTAEDAIRGVFRLPVQLHNDNEYYKLQFPPDAKYIDFITPEGELKRKYRAQPAPTTAPPNPLGRP